MQVRFDSLNRFEIPTFYVCNPGCVYENNTLTNVLGCISGTSDEELIMNFNTTSELNMRVHKIHTQDPEEDAYIQNIYKALQNRRLIFIEDVGFFVITNVVDGYEAGLHYKDIQAASCEYELGNRVLPYIEDGTYKFTDLLEKIVSSLPVWKIGEVNGDIANKYRTFEDVSVEQNALAFMLEDMQDAYECIFEYDCVRRLINVYDQNAYVRQTSIHLTRDDLINSVEITENSDDLYTAISVQGDENLNISPVNPLGTNVIYNFDYYLDWMSHNLREKVVAWQDLVRSKLDIYHDLNLDYYSGLTEKTGYSSELSKLEIQLTMYQRCRDNIVASGSTVTVKSYNEVIEKNGGVPVGAQNEIAATLSEIDKCISDVRKKIADTESAIEEASSSQASILDKINAIHDEVSILSYFTDTEYSELCNYIFEGNYTDEHITVTGSMTYDERFRQMKTLYDRAVMRLERVSSPTQEFDLDVENFIFSKKFEAWSNELETGSLINVELDINDIAALFLSNITVNYDDKKLTMTFGNRFNRFDPKSMFNDVLGDIKRSANSIGYIKEILYPVKDGEFDEMKEAIESSGILTKDAVLASVDQEILIDDTGILGRQLLENGEYADEQIKITNKTIVFTDDGWETAKTAIGNFIYNNPFTGEPESHYGVIADMLVGGMVLTQDLGVHNEANSITMNSDGFTLTSDYTGSQPRNMVFTIQNKLLDEKGNPYYSKQLYIDDDGNLVLNGTISVFSPATGGSTNLEDLTPSGTGAPQYLHIKYSDDGRTFTGNILANISSEKFRDGMFLNDDIIVAGDNQTAIHITYLLEIDSSKTYLFDTHNSSTYFFVDLYDGNHEPIGVSKIIFNGQEVSLGYDAEYMAVNIVCDSGISVDGYNSLLEDGLLLEICQLDIRGEGPGTYIGTLLSYEDTAPVEFNAYKWELFTDVAQEDIDALYQALQNNTNSINKTVQNVSDKLYGEIKNETGIINSSINSRFDEISQSIRDQLGNVTTDIDSRYSQIMGNIDAQLSAHKADLGQYLTFNDDGLTLGASTSQFKTIIDNTGLYFKQGDVIVSYVDNNQLHIPNAVIENTLILGNFFFCPREDGGVSLTWQE